MQGYLIVYEKPDYSIEYKTVCHRPQIKVGEQNSYRWKVLDIKILYKGKVISKEAYKKELYKQSKLKELIYFTHNINIKKLLEFFIILLLLYYFTH